MKIDVVRASQKNERESIDKVNLQIHERDKDYNRMIEESRCG